MLIQSVNRQSCLIRVWVRTWERDELGRWHGITKPRLDAEFHNTLTNAWNNLLRVSLGTVTDTKTKYMETGTNNTAPAATQTALVAPSFRKACTSYVNGGTGVITITTYLAPGESNVAIAELGWFGGSAATSTTGSGTMVSRVLYSRTKTSAESLSVERQHTFV